MLKRFIGTKSFYKKVLVLAIPIMLQNGITNFVNMLDNIMVGQVGTVQMTGVAVANQLIFVFNLCIFGLISGAGIFGAQYFGKGDHDGVRHTFRFKILSSVVLTVLGIILLTVFCNPLITMYLKGEGNAQDIKAAFFYAKDYMFIIFIGLLPYSLSQCYSSTLRECDQPVLPMVAGAVAVGVNLCLNYVLIYGKFGAPVMGVRGAAIATVISRFAELGVVLMWTRMHAKKNPFIIGAYRRIFDIPRNLVKQFIIKGMPLMTNEAFWAGGVAFVNKCYSEQGLDVVAATNIMQTFFNVFSVTFMAVGVANGIILGQMIGSGDKAGAKRSSAKLIAFSMFVSVIVGGIFFCLAGFIPSMYNTTDSVRLMAKRLIQICALYMPMDAFVHSAYFTLRSGGKTFITLIFDSCFMWCINVPAALILVRCTNLNILQIYALCQAVNLIKCVLGMVLVKRGTWIKTLVAEYA